MIAQKLRHLKYRLIISYLLVSLVPIIIMGIYAITSFESNIKEITLDSFAKENEAKLRALDGLLNSLKNQMEMISYSEDSIVLFDVFNDFKSDTGIADDASYNVAAEDYLQIRKYNIGIAEKFITNFQYEDILVINKFGQLMFSYSDTKLAGSNIRTGEYKDTHLASAWKEISETGKFTVTDYKVIKNYSDAPVAFVGVPIHDRKKNPVGVLLISISDKTICKYLGNCNRSAATILVGSDNLPRSSISLEKDGDLSVSEGLKRDLKISSAAINEALKGNSGVVIASNHNGVNSLSAYSPFKFGEKVTWAIITERPSTVVFATINNIIFYIIVLIIILFFVVIFIGSLASNKIAMPISIIGKELASNSENMESTAEKLSEQSGELSAAATQQASSLEETSASLEEIGGMVGANTDSTKLLTNKAENSLRVVRDADLASHHMQQAIDEIAKSNIEISQIVKLIQEIQAKTTVIDEIVFQTKLLSFNASVEAERAGEHGRGFAVVAQEVGNLAALSGKAATEINDIVKKSVSTTLEVSSKNKKLVDNGQQTVADLLRILEVIKVDMKDIVVAAGNIYKSSKEQTQGIKQINVALSQLDDIAQKNTTSANGMARFSIEAKGLTGRLAELSVELDRVIYR